MNPIPPACHIAKPCPKLWSDLVGDDKRRFCSQCQLHVHDLSAMQETERAEFLSAQTGSVCITYELAEDGSIATPVRAGKLRRMWEKTRLSAAAVFAVGFPFLFSSCTEKSAKSRLTGSVPPTRSGSAQSPTPQPDETPRVMGKVRLDSSPPSAPSKP